MAIFNIISNNDIYCKFDYYKIKIVVFIKR